MQIDEVLQQTLVYEVDHEKVVVVVLREEKIQFRAVLSKSFFQSSLAGESVNLKRTKRQIKILNLISTWISSLIFTNATCKSVWVTLWSSWSNQIRQVSIRPLVRISSTEFSLHTTSSYYLRHNTLKRLPSSYYSRHNTLVSLPIMLIVKQFLQLIWSTWWTSKSRIANADENLIKKRQKAPLAVG